MGAQAPMQGQPQGQGGQPPGMMRQPGSPGIQTPQANPFAVSAMGGFPGAQPGASAPSTPAMNFQPGRPGGMMPFNPKGPGGMAGFDPSMLKGAYGLGGGQPGRVMQGGRDITGMRMPDAPDGIHFRGGGPPTGIGVTPGAPPQGGQPPAHGAPPVLGGPPTPISTGPPMPPGGPQPNDPFSKPTSAMDVYRSAVPVMQDALKTNVGSAMADAGFGGNRFSSSAMDRAAQEGSRAGLQQNQLMTDLLHKQTNQDLDRSLQASGMGMQHGIAQNQMQLDNMRHLFDVGRYEQDRQDGFSRLSYEDFQKNMLGFLPMLSQMAQSPGTATSPVWGNQQSGGSPGAFDYAQLLAQIYGAYQGGQG